MSNLTVKGNASGTGTIILESPNTNSNRTITLPDATATLASTAYVDAASSIVHLGTITTTSGSSVSLSGLTLTSYKQLQFFINGVSTNAAPNVPLLLNSYRAAMLNVSGGADVTFGEGNIDLSNGVFGSNYAVYSGTTFQGTGGGGGLSGLTTASTSITFTISGATFDAGSILVYGVK